jgi:hypothetical protein
MSETPKPFSAATHTRKPPPPPVDLTKLPVKLHARTDKFRPVLGGVAVQSKTKDGTLGICFPSKTGGKRLLTAAHVFGNDIGGDLGQPKYGDRIGAMMEAAPDFNDVPVDVAMVNVSNANINENAVLGDIITYYIDVYEDWTEEGDRVQIEGAVSGMSAGNVIHPLATLNLPDGTKVAAAVAGYASALGDSGAPVIFFPDNGEAHLVGLHGGQVKIQGVWYSWFSPVGTFSKWAFG